MKKGERTNPELQMETIDYIAGGLNKERSSFTAQDIITFVQNEGIELLNFGYVGGDGRIKTLSFTPTASCTKASAWTAPAFSSI
jgi:hypothetical protein